MSRGMRNLLLTGAGAGFMLGLVFLANPAHFSYLGSFAGGALSAGSVVVAILAFRARESD